MLRSLALTLAMVASVSTTARAAECKPNETKAVEQIGNIERIFMQAPNEYALMVRTSDIDLNLVSVNAFGLETGLVRFVTDVPDEALMHVVKTRCMSGGTPASIQLELHVHSAAAIRPKRSNLQ